MNAGVTWSGSPNQNASTFGSCMPALAMSRIFEPARPRTAGRASGKNDRVSGISPLYRDLVGIAPVTLRRVERAVGTLEQRLGRCLSAVAECHADARRHLHRRIAGNEFGSHGGDDLARDEAALLARVDAFEDDH